LSWKTADQLAAHGRYQTLEAGSQEVLDSAEVRPVAVNFMARRQGTETAAMPTISPFIDTNSGKNVIRGAAEPHTVRTRPGVHNGARAA
jgi:hypothetical protein